MKTLQARLALLALAALLPLSGQASPPHKPLVSWRVLENPRFQLIYPPELESEAPRVLAQAEAEYERLRKLFGEAPRAQINLILADESDDSNGYATMYPASLSGLLLAPPDDPPELGDLEDWTRRLLAHELTHVFQFETTHGLPRFFGALFGRFPLFYPSVFQPAWIPEGLATWSESEPENYWGRGQDAYYKGLMRVELESGFKTLRQVNQPTRRWPGGTTRYLYGVYFTQFLERRFGREEVAKWAIDYNDDLLPYFINRNAKRHFGKRLPGLWKDFEADLRQRWAADFAALSPTSRVGRPAPAHLRAQGYRSYPPRVNAHGELFTVLDDGQRPARLVRLAPGEQWDEIAVLSTRCYAIDEARGRALLVERDLKQQVVPSARLQAVDLKTKKRVSLGSLKGLREVLALPESLLAIVWRGGRHELLRLDLDGREMESLWRADKREVISGLTLSPDGKQALSAMWQAGEGWDLRVFDFEKKKWGDLVAGPANEIQPAFGADGLLYYSSDQGGVYNIWRCRSDGSGPERLTRVLGGAFHPAPGQRGILYFATLSAEGYALATAPLGPGLKEPLALGPPRERPSRERAPKEVSYERGDYSSLLNAMPAYWLPIPTGAFSDENHSVGISLQGQDLLERHAYSGSIALNRQSALGPAYEASYSYRRFWPQLSVGMTRDTQDQGYGWGYLTHQGWLGVELPWTSAWRDMGLAYYEWFYREQRVDMSVNLGQELGPPDESRWREIDAWFDSTRGYPQALHGVDGWLLQAYASKREDPSRDELSFGFASAAYPLGLGRAGSLTPRVAYQAMLSGPYVFSYDAHRDGFEGVYVVSDRALASSLRWSFLLWSVERGIMAPPLGLDRIHGSLSLKSVSLGSGDGGLERPWVSAEARLNVDWMLGYAVPFPISVYVRHGIGDNAHWQWGLSAGILPYFGYSKKNRPASFDTHEAGLIGR